MLADTASPSSLLPAGLEDCSLLAAQKPLCLQGVRTHGSPAEAVTQPQAWEDPNAAAS